MERRAFLTGLLGFAGAIALAGVAQAAPIARSLDLPDATTPPLPGGMTPDGTPVEQAQVSVRIGSGRGGHHRHHHHRRHHRRSRMVCRTHWSRGRRVQSCRRVYY